MGAGLGWIDFSTEDRDRVMSVIDLLSAAGAVDELGIGTTRDSLADRMFPGISTIQTRPKYFLLIPQIFREYQRMAKTTRRMPVLKDFLLKKEKELIELLAKNHGYQLGQGVIGITKAGTSAGLARYPSSIYWNGLRAHGLIETSESLAEYLRRCNLSERELNKIDGDDDFLDDEFGIGLSNLPHYHDQSKLELNKEEGLMLRDYFRDVHRGKKSSDNLLSLILSSNERMEIVAKASSFNPMAELLLPDEDLPESIRKVVLMALQFDFLMHGAHIRYNMMLYDRFGNEQGSDLVEKWGGWIEDVEAQRWFVEKFDLDLLFSSVATNVNENTVQFIKEWKRLVLEEQTGVDEMSKLIKHQELRIKGGRAKLLSKEFAYEGWVGMDKLEYRFIQVKNFVTDIINSDATP
jgi:hypothetical protein